jgi:C4-dicarboxylate transporter DctM subunit
MPIVLLRVIFMGVCTPTEAAAVACVYTILVACLIYRTVGLKDLFRIFEDSAVAAGAIMFLMGNSKISGYVMAIAKVPGTIASAILSVSDNPVVIMVLINIFLLIVGMFMEGNAAIVILTPILLPIAKLCGMNGIQFGVLMCVNLCMGLVTPPVGGCLHIGTMIANTKIEKVFIKCLPFLLVELLTLALVTSVPAFTLAAAGVK